MQRMCLSPLVRRTGVRDWGLAFAGLIGEGAEDLKRKLIFLAFCMAIYLTTFNPKLQNEFVTEIALGIGCTVPVVVMQVIRKLDQKSIDILLSVGLLSFLSGCIEDLMLGGELFWGFSRVHIPFILMGVFCLSGWRQMRLEAGFNQNVLRLGYFAGLLSGLFLFFPPMHTESRHDLGSISHHA